MPEEPLFAVTAGGRRLGFLLRAVKAVQMWRPPLPLPGAAPWVNGILPGEGEAWPVLKPSFWETRNRLPATGGRQPEPGDAASEVYVLLSLHGRVLALPGSAPAIVKSSAVPQEEGEDGLLAESFEETGKQGFRVKVEELYSELGLDYNEAPLG